VPFLSRPEREGEGDVREGKGARKGRKEGGREGKREQKRLREGDGILRERGRKGTTRRGKEGARERDPAGGRERG
jgi:hypothetical protein